MSTHGSDASTSETNAAARIGATPDELRADTKPPADADRTDEHTVIASLDGGPTAPEQRPFSPQAGAEPDLSLTAEVTGDGVSALGTPSTSPPPTTRASEPAAELALTEQLLGTTHASPATAPVAVNSARHGAAIDPVDVVSAAPSEPATLDAHPVDTLSTFGFGLPPEDEASTETSRLRLAETAIAVLRSGKFRHGRPLGEGGAGVVNAAFDLSLKRDLAIKTLKSPDDTNMRIRFIDEAQITGQLQHPNIVPVYELALDDEAQPMLVMKRVHGKTLRALIREIHNATPVGERLSTRDERRLLDAFIKICDAIAFAHSKRVIHRDLKPENVMVGEYGEVLVMDWGLAKPLDGAETHIREGRKGVISDRRMGSIEVTMEGAVSGTLPYMPPEQARGGEKLTQTADVYSLGAILYVMLTDVLPFTGAHRVLMRGQVINGEFPRPSEAAHERRVPPELEAIVLKAMSRSRGARYPSVTELREDVERYLDGKTVSVARYTMLDRTRKWIDNNRAVAAGIAATLAAVMIGVIVAVVLVNEAELARRAKAITELEAERSVAQEAERRAVSERERRDLEYKALLQEGQIEELADSLGVAMQTQYKKLVDEFMARINEMRAMGLSDPAIAARITPTRFADYIAAFDEYFSAHQRYPDSVVMTPKHWLNRGVLLHLAGRDRELVKRDLQKAVELYGASADRAEPLMLLGVIAADQGDVQSALRLLNESLALRNTTRCLFNRAHALFLAGRLDDAMSDLDTLLQIDSEDSSNWWERAVVWQRMGEPDKAMADIEVAVSLAPDNPSILLTRGTLLMTANQPAAALADFEQAAELMPDDALCHVNRAGALGDLDRPLEALEAIGRALALDPTNVRAHLFRGTTYARLSETELAIDAFTDALAIRADDVDALSSRARAYRLIEEFELALADAERAHALAPNDLSIRYLLALAHMNTGMFEEAVVDFTALAEGRPDDAWEFLANRAIAHSFLDNEHECRRDFAAALETAPDEDAKRLVRQFQQRFLGD